MSKLRIIEMCENDSGEKTLHGYFKQLLLTLWEEDEGFSGKRPFGNSGWKNDIYPALIAKGIVEGKLDEDGFIDEIDSKSVDIFIIEYINVLFKGII